MSRWAATTQSRAASTAKVVEPLRSTVCSMNGGRQERRTGRRASPGIGTVDWLFREYKASKRYREAVSHAHDRTTSALMQLVIDLPTKGGDRVGQRPVKSITPLARGQAL